MIFVFKRWIRVFLALLLGMPMGALMLAYVMAGDIYEYTDTVDGVHLPKVDAIVCLAGGRGRIAAAGDVWFRYWEASRRDPLAQIPTLYIAGMGHLSNWKALGYQLRRGVLDVLRAENVVLETESENTEANAKYLVEYARKRGWKRILLMTSPYHMKRSRLIFDRVMRSLDTPLEIETLSVFQEPYGAGEWRRTFQGIRVTVTEFLKWVYYKSF
jgi:uncharacterized SAM-binding protein YcdF (DUF218 family)